MILPLILLVANSMSAPAVDYVRDIKPVLQERCFACHGALAQKAGLRLDGHTNLLKGGKHGPILTAGKPADSSLLERLQSPDEGSRMPPEGQPLKPEQVQKFQLWIQQGAVIPKEDKPETDPRDHWAFHSPVRPPLPKTRANEAHPIDRLVAAEREKRGLTPVPAAEPRLLLRRLYLDLTGLPPSEEETRTFLADPSPDAYAHRVEKLLNSPQYGERWGRHFLDIWRYSDWWGLGAEVRNSQKHMWHWRDWVVESFNTDLGYDEMVRRMLAADELYPNDLSQLRATGYLARQYFKFNRNSWLEETVEHTSKAFLGLTWNCARCHDHKYDPIKQVDYYRFRAFFEPYQVRTEFAPGEIDIEKNGIPRGYDCDLDRPTYLFVRGDEKNPVKTNPITPGLPQFLCANPVKVEAKMLPLEAYFPQLRPFIPKAYIQAEGRDAAEAIQARYEADRLRVTGSMEEARAAAKRAHTAEQELIVHRAEAALKKAEADLAKAKGIARIGPALKRKKAADAVVTAKKAAEKPGETYTSLKGAIKTLESNVESEASRNKPFPKTTTGRRTALANWIASTENPLTARVAVNHVWARHFGQPLVANVFEFGRKGTPPTHPELLDFLAVEFMENHWSFKHIHKLIVTSQAYQLSSSSREATETDRKVDAENRYLWRQNPVRMDAPTLRDSLLALSGKLDRSLGGKAIPVAEQEQSTRRSIYFFHSHNEHNKFLSLFDDANVLECYRRTESIVPQQALALSNSPFAMTQARAIADRLSKLHADLSDSEYIRVAFQAILASSPTDEEQTLCQEAMKEWRQLVKGSPDDKTRRARQNLAQSLVNHNDFLTVR